MGNRYGIIDMSSVSCMETTGLRKPLCICKSFFDLKIGHILSKQFTEIIYNSLSFYSFFKKSLLHYKILLKFIFCTQ